MKQAHAPCIDGSGMTSAVALCLITPTTETLMCTSRFAMRRGSCPKLTLMVISVLIGENDRPAVEVSPMVSWRLRQSKAGLSNRVWTLRS